MKTLSKTKSIIYSLAALFFSFSVLVSCGGGGGSGGGDSDDTTGSPVTPGFAVSIVDSAGDVGTFTSIALGSVHISYYDETNGTVKYAYNNGSSWTYKSADSSIDAVGEYTSIALDASNNAHISYYDVDNQALKYTTNITSSFVATSIDTSGSAGEHTSIAVEASGIVHITYYEYIDPGNDILKYATCTSSCSNDLNWNTYTVDDSADGVGEYTSMALNGSTLHISYYDYIDNGTPGDPSDDEGHLKYATGTAGSFNFTDVDNIAGDAGQTTSIFVEADGTAHISYYDVTNEDLKYATCSSSCTTGSNWSIETVDSTGDVGEYSSIAVEADGTVHISYYDWTNLNLKYATGTAGSFITETVDSSGDVGMYSSIAVETDGTIHISYYDWDNGDLKYATK